MPEAKKLGPLERAMRKRSGMRIPEDEADLEEKPNGKGGEKEA